MAGLVPAIHVFESTRIFKTWMPGTRPGMTSQRSRRLVLASRATPLSPIAIRRGLPGATFWRTAAATFRFRQLLFGGGLQIGPLAREPGINPFGRRAHLRAEVEQESLPANESHEGCVNRRLPLGVPGFLEPCDQFLAEATRFHESKEAQKIIEKGRCEDLLIAIERG